MYQTLEDNSEKQIKISFSASFALAVGIIYPILVSVRMVCTYKTTSQSPVVAPVDAWVKCSNDWSSRDFRALSPKESWNNISNTRQTICPSAILSSTRENLELGKAKLGQQSHISERNFQDGGCCCLRICFWYFFKMPFVLMCGFPSSGKTQIADKLRIYFEGERGKIVHFIGDDSIGIDRNVTYASKSFSLSTTPKFSSHQLIHFLLYPLGETRS